MDSPPPFHAPVTAERHSDSSGDRPSTCHRRDLRTRFKTVSRLVMADFSGDLRPDFAIDIEPVKPGRVWRCAAIRCWCWSQCLGLRWNLRNTRRFASWQMCATFIYCFLGVFFNVYMQVDAERRSLAFRALPVKYNFSEADTDTFTTLPDLGFDVLPFVSESWLSDLAVVLLVVLTQIRFSLTPMGATIVRRWVFLLGSLFVLRGVSIVITMLPNPLKNCRSTALDYHPAVASLMIISAQVVTCGDVLFSGHTVNLTLAALVWQTYSHKAGVQLCKPNLCPTCFDPIGAIFCKDTPVENDAGHLVRATTAKIFIWICAIVGMLTIIATRFHYSIDVFIGFCLCLLLWKLYHYYLITIYIDCEKWHNRVLGWLERDSEEFSVDKQLVEEGMTALQAIAGGPAETVSDVDTVALQIDQ